MVNQYTVVIPIDVHVTEWRRYDVTQRVVDAWRQSRVFFA